MNNASKKCLPGVGNEQESIELEILQIEIIKKNSRVKFFESEKTLQMTSESENMYVCV